ncbi:MAG TPA: carboxypeptidase regulatory-like domain-containing protein [Verrucomicrobiae bacterium]|nr:carboxypeptidase regulatory-like domain-containing protein [Verrucomicrobiae bacterium]
MRKLTWGILCLLAAAWLMAVIPSAMAQEVTAAVVGTVTDPSNAPIKGATVTATDTERGTVWTAQTNDSGAYNLLRLPVGSYTVKVTASGFETAVEPAFTLVLNQTARVDVKLKVGQVSETVEVTGAAPILQTQSTEVSTVIDSTTNESLPLGTRDYLSLTLLAPGATTPNPSEFTSPGLITSSGRPYINGNREQANAMLLDGIDASENSNNEVGYTPSPDAIQEFNLITQNASAEFGSYEGGVISTTIKSGTNQFHGSAFEYYRDGNFNANLWSNGLSNPVVPRPGLVWNQFGLSVGGPIIKNKLFFFADYEGQRFDTPPSGANVFVLTNAERGGDFGALCTDAGGTFDNTGICNGGLQITDPNNGNAPIPYNNFANASVASQTENPVTAALFNAIPAGNPQGNLASLNGQQINNDQGDLKIDYNISNSDHIYGRWSQAHIRNPFTSTFALSSLGPQDQPVRNFSGQWLHTLSSNLLNELRVGFNVVDFTNPSGTAGNVGDLAQTIGISGGNAYLGGLPNVVAGSFNIGSAGLYQAFHTSTPQVDDSFSITHGRHQVKLGFQYERLREDNVYSGNSGELGSITFNSLTGSPLADLWMGNVASAARGDVPPVFGRRANVFGAFAQDDWRISDTLTLNLGLRFEDHTPFYEIHNQEVNFAGGGLVAGGLQVEQGNDTLYKNYTGIGDFLPRIGISWAPAALQNKTVIRAGYGVSAYTEGGGVGEQLTANYPFSAASYNANFPNQVGNFANVFANAQVTQPCATITLSCYQGVGSIYMFDPNFRPALAQQWNLTVQQQLSNATTFQIGYVGQHGTHLYNFMEYNQAPLLDSSGAIITKPGVLGTAGTPYYLSGNPTLLSDITFARGNASNSDQRYDALQAVLRHRMSSGLDAQVAYTYSKCMSNSGGFYGTWGASQTSHGQVGWTSIYAPRMDWGPCFFDETHILTSYVTYQLPVGRGKIFGNSMNRVMDAAVGGWEIGGLVTFHSGNAMSDFTGWGADYPAFATTGASELFGGDRSNCNGPIHYTKTFVPATMSTSAYIQWVDPSTFSEPTTSGGQVAYGTCSQGDIRGPRYADVDLSLHKLFPVSERMKFEFRAEAYNVFNHPALAAPDMTLSDGTVRGFGAITNSQGARQLQLALRFTF